MSHGWHKQSNDLASNPKVSADSITGEAFRLWVMMRAVSGRDLLDGQVRPFAVAVGYGLEDVALVDGLVDELVAAGLVHRPGHACERCEEVPPGRVLVHDWRDYQTPRSEVEAFRQERARRGRAGAAKRWAKDDPDSSLPRQPAMAGAMAGAIAEVEVEVDNQSPRSLRAVGGISPDDWQTIRALTKGDQEHAEKTAEAILSGSKGVKAPGRYVVAAIKKAPNDHVQRARNPKRSEECPDHPGQWANRCVAHMQENLGVIP